MWRSVHSVIGLVAIVFVCALAISGTILSAAPVIDQLHRSVQQTGTLSVADALEVLEPRYQEIERLTRTPAGAFILTHIGADGQARVYVDVHTGTTIGPVTENAFFAALRDFHRSFMLGQTGRIAAGCCAGLMAILCISGTMLLVRRAGGLAGLFGPLRGGPVDRLHAAAGRLTMLPLVITALTGVYLTLVTFQLLPNGQEDPPAYPESPVELNPVAPHTLDGLDSIPLAQLREVIFPIPGDWFDVFAVKTTSGHVFIDQFTGDVLSTAPYHPAQSGLEWMHALHTGEGMAWWGVMVGLCAQSVPIFAVTGLIIWWKSRQLAGPRVKGDVGPRHAEIALLVGSETGSTWGFARHLHERLTEAGRHVHLAGMNQLRADYPRLRHLVVLTATYGDGHAPKSATQFAGKIARLTRGDWRHAVVGFGDKAFPNFCQFAAEADGLLHRYNGEALLPAFFINRGSAQAFTHWGAQLGEKLGVQLALDYEPPRPATRTLKLIERREHGQVSGQPTVILRFAMATGRVPRHQAGDLVGIVPPGSNLGRFYSLASRHADGSVEICVKLQEGGLCSGFLHQLHLGDTAEGFIRTNPEFQLPSGRRPVLLIGAGTGIAPLIGMARANRAGRPIDLYWGGREPLTDFLFQADIDAALAEERLSRFVPAFSRSDDRAYVQDRIRANAASVAARLRAGGSVLVCGSPQMADAVRTEIDSILEPTGRSVAQLRRRGRYLEDVY